MPFAAARLGNPPPAALAVYGLSMVAAGLSRWAHWHYTTHGRRLIDQELPTADIRAVGRRFLLVPFLYVPIVPLGWWQPTLAFWLLALLPLRYIPVPRQDAHLTSLPPPAVDFAGCTTTPRVTS